MKIINELLPQAEGNKDIENWVKGPLKRTIQQDDSLTLGQCEHMLDYLKSDQAPKNITSSKVATIKKATENWQRSLINAAAGIVETEQDIEVIKTWENGFRFVKLVGKAAFEREGKLMGHCIASYYGKNDSENYSLRDSLNKPHATIELIRNGTQIQQVKGKGNGPIHPKYIKYILEMHKEIGAEIRPSELSNMGYKELPSQLWSIIDAVCKPPAELTMNNTRYLFIHKPLKIIKEENQAIQIIREYL